MLWKRVLQFGTVQNDAWTAPPFVCLTVTWTMNACRTDPDPSAHSRLSTISGFSLEAVLLKKAA